MSSTTNENDRKDLRRTWYLSVLNFVMFALFGVAGIFDSCDQAARLDSLEEQRIIELVEAWRPIIDTDPGRVLRESEPYLEAEEPTVFTIRGDALVAAGDLNGAVESYQNAVSLDPGAAEAQQKLGIAYVRQGKADAAIQPLLIADGLGNESSLLPADQQLTLIWLASAYADTENTGEAKRVMNLALEEHPDLIPNEVIFFSTKGKIHEAEENYGGAVRAYKEALAHSRTAASSYIALASAQEMNGDSAGVVETLELLKEIEPAIFARDERLETMLKIARDQISE